MSKVSPWFSSDILILRILYSTEWPPILNSLSHLKHIHLFVEFSSMMNKEAAALVTSTR